MSIIDNYRLNYYNSKYSNLNKYTYLNKRNAYFHDNIVLKKFLLYIYG